MFETETQTWHSLKLRITSNVNRRQQSANFSNLPPSLLNTLHIQKWTCHFNATVLQSKSCCRSVCSSLRHFVQLKVSSMFASGFSYRASFKYYIKVHQHMSLFFCNISLLYVSTLHVSGLYQPIIRGIPSCCYVLPLGSCGAWRMSACVWVFRCSASVGKP